MILRKTHYERVIARQNAQFNTDSATDMWKHFFHIDDDTTLGEFVDNLMQHFLQKEHQLMTKVLLSDERLKSMPPELMQNTIYGELSTFVKEATTLFMFERHHRKIYEITDDLGLMLFNTSLKNVRKEIFQLPYECVYIGFNEDLFQIYHNATGLHKAYGAYLYMINDPRMVKYLLDPEFAGRPVERFVFTYICGLPNEQSRDEMDDSIYHFGFPIFTDDTNVMDALTTFEDHWNKKFGVGYENTLGIFNFLMNAVLYITGADCDVTYMNTRDLYQAKLKRVKNAGKLRKLDNLNRLPRYMVGQTIHLSREEREYYRGAKTGTKITSRTLVQGHWRNQSHGEKHSLRKHIWIRPFWRGPELGDIIHRKHVVEY